MYMLLISHLIVFEGIGKKNFKNKAVLISLHENHDVDT